MATITELLADAQTIFDETAAGANTHQRIGQMFLDIIDFIADNQYIFTSINDGSGFLYADADLISLIQEFSTPLDNLTARLFAAAPQVSGTTAPAWSTFVDLAASDVQGDGNNFIDYSQALTAWEAQFGAASGFLGEFAWFFNLITTPDGNTIITPRFRVVIENQP